MIFVGRSKELAELSQLKNKKTSSLVVIKGRRRIGKSRLVEEFSKNYTYYSFAGFPPSENDTKDRQRQGFALQLEKYFHFPIRYDSWYELFIFLASQIKDKNVVILLDEISWMGANDSTFLSDLKTAWDQHLKQNPNLLLVICGSISSWIDKNILSNTGFVGRISSVITLRELSLKESSLFWGQKNEYISPYEKLKVLSVTGGVPRYLEEINPHESAEENIKRLCFSPSGILYREFDQIFSDLFSSRMALYKKIVQALVEGSLESKDLAKKVDLPQNGKFFEYLNDLVTADFLRKDPLWNLSKQKQTKTNLYRLSDNYLRFYLKYIDPHKDKIEADFYKNVHLSLSASFPGWSTIMGLQVENLVLSNRSLILNEIGIPPETIVNQGPYRQFKNKRYPGCQIDYLVQTKDTLYLTEIKFEKNPLEKEIIEEVKQRIHNFKYPKGFSVRPVLVHVNGVKDTVEEEMFFRKIIDLSKMV